MSEDYDRKIVDDIIEAHAKQRGLDKIDNILSEAIEIGEDLTEGDVERIIKKHNLSPKETVIFFILLADSARNITYE
jgi:hypothetical protein